MAGSLHRLVHDKVRWTILCFAVLTVGLAVSLAGQDSWGIFFGLAMLMSVLGNWVRNRKETKELERLHIYEACTFGMGVLFVGSLFYANVHNGLDLPAVEPVLLVPLVSFPLLVGYLISVLRHR